MKHSPRLLVVLALFVAVPTAFAAPYRCLRDATGSPPFAQWFQDVSTGQLQDSHCEFYDNPVAPGFPDYPWGGQSGSLAISGRVTSLQLTPNRSIIAFTMDVKVTNDTYTWLWGMNGTSANGYGNQSALEIPLNLQTTMYDVRLALEFAQSDLLGYPWSQIYTVDHDDLAWHGYSLYEPPTTYPDYGGGFSVPAFRLGDLGPGQTVTRSITCGLSVPVPPGSELYDLIVASKEVGADILVNRTSALKTIDYPGSLFVDDGSTSPVPQYYYSGNVSVFFDVSPSEGAVYLSLGASSPGDHYWWEGKSGGTADEMMQVAVTAGPDEAIDLRTMQLGGFGWDDLAMAVSAVEAYADDDADGRVEPGEALIARGKFEPYNEICQFAFSPSVRIAAGSTKYVNIAFRMAASASYWGEYTCVAIRMRATSAATGAELPVYGLSITSCRRVVIQPPVVVSIGEAKQLETGRPVIVENKPLTCLYYDLAWIEEPDRTSGIRVVGLSTDYPPPPPPPVGGIAPGEGGAAMATILGVTEIDYSYDEAMIRVLQGSVTLDPLAAPIAPVAMSNRATGGAACGYQAGMVDDVRGDSPRYAIGLSSIGLLVRTSGVVTAVDRLNARFWLDDGSNLCPGTALAETGEQAKGMAVQFPSGWWYEDVPQVGAHVCVTGVMRCHYNDFYQPVRWLWPRDQNDVINLSGGSDPPPPPPF